MVDTIKLLQAAGYNDRFSQISQRVIEEKAHELACDHLYEYPFLTYNQAREETAQNVEMWVEREAKLNMSASDNVEDDDITYG